MGTPTTVRHRGRHVFDSIQADYIRGLPQHIIGRQYFVDPNTGSDNNPGTNPNKPLATLAQARTLSNTTIDWAQSAYQYNIIWVAPEVYDEYFAGGFYYAHVVGLGNRGTDTQAEIHPSTTGGVFRTDATFLGTCFHNMRFENDIVSVPIFDLGICNSSLIENCEFALGADVAGVVAIDTTNSTHFNVEDCDFTSGMGQNLAYAFYHRGGANKYLHNARYLRNRIFAASGGIYIADGCTASQAIIKENLVHVDGTGIGIDGRGGGSDTGGDALVVNNEIIIVGAGDAIHGLAAGKKLYNKTIVNGTFAYETALA